MAHAKIVVNVTDKHGNPMIGLEVELVDTNAFTPANHDPIEHVVAIESTDISGTATFTGLSPSMYYARPRITRPDIRIQTMMASGIGILCYSAVVDPNGRGTHTTIQAAITALGTGGGTILICAGIYQENLVVAGDTENLWLIGISRNCVTIQGTAASPTITVDAVGTGPVVNFRLEHLTIDHTGAQTLLYFNSMGGGQPTKVDLDDLRFLSGAMGIDLSNASGGTKFNLRDLVFESTCVAAGQLQVSDLSVSNCRLYCSGNGLYAAGSSAATGIRIGGCLFGSSGSYCLRIGNANDVQVSNCRFLSLGAATAGILASHGLTKLVVDGCTIDCIDGIGIDLSNVVGVGTIISDCNLSCASGQAVAREGISVSGYCVEVTISDCRIRGFESFGIRLRTLIATGAQHFVLDGNLIKNGGDTHSISIGGWDYGTVTGCVLVGTGGDNTTYGIYGAAGTTNVVVVGNVERDHDGMTNLTNGVDGNVIGSNTGSSGSGMGPSPHVAVTLDANADTLLSLNVQELGLDTQLANLVFSGPAAGGAAVPTFRSLVDLDIPAAIMRDQEHTDIGDAAPHHAAVTLGAGSDATLALAGQELTLADVLTPAEHTAIGDAAPHHVRYADAEAIAAVEYEATLDLLGDVTIAAAKSLSVNTVVEKTVDAGVTVDTVLLKDGVIYPDSGDLQRYLQVTGGNLYFVGLPGNDYLQYTPFNDPNPSFWAFVVGEGYRLVVRADEVQVRVPLKVNTINEYTADAGVTLEGVTALDSFLQFTEIAKPADPAANKLRLYTKDKAGVSALYFLQDNGTEVEVGAGGGGGGDEIVDADADTKIQVEESADEDKIRMDVAGTERYIMENSPVARYAHHKLTGDVSITEKLIIGRTTPLTVDQYLRIDPGTRTISANDIALVVANSQLVTIDGNRNLNAFNMNANYNITATHSGIARGLSLSAIKMGAGTADKLYASEMNLMSHPNASGAITDARGFNIVAYWLSEKPTSVYGGYIGNMGSASIGLAEGLHIDDQAGATTNRILELGPATPYMRLRGGAAPAAGESNLELRIGTTSQLVTVGAADSGGAGFRMMRVPNA